MSVHKEATSTRRGQGRSTDRLAKMCAAANAHVLKSGPKCGVCALDNEAKGFIAEQVSIGTPVSAIATGLAEVGIKFQAQRIRRHLRECGTSVPRE